MQERTNGNTSTLAGPAAPRRAFWQPAPCPPWCISEHRDGDRYEDRSHASVTAEVPLTLDDAEPAGGDDYEVQVVSACLRQHYRDAEAEIEVWKLTGPAVLRMTLAEALALGRHLVRLAEVGEAESVIAAADAVARRATAAAEAVPW